MGLNSWAKVRRLCAVSTMGALAACASSASHLPSGQAAYSVMEPTGLSDPSYLLGPGDKITIIVYGQPDMSMDGVTINPQGTINMPLLGSVAVEGVTADQLASKIEAAFRPAYLRHPQVSVNVVEYGSKIVTVDGQVVRPAVIPIMGTMRLSRLIAMAGGPAQLAKLNEVIVVRERNGERLAARFDLKAIRQGEMADPAIYGGDMVVIGYNSLKGVYRDLLTAIPLVALFQRF